MWAVEVDIYSVIQNPKVNTQSIRSINTHLLDKSLFWLKQNPKDQHTVNKINKTYVYWMDHLIKHKTLSEDRQ